MPVHTLHDTVTFSLGFAPIAAITNVNTASVTEILDTQGYEANEFILQMGAITDADVTFVVLMEESDESDMTGANDVADEDLVGTEVEAAPLFSDDDDVFSLGYKGSKRYIRVTLTPSANSAGDIFRSATWAQFRKRHNI